MRGRPTWYGSSSEAAAWAELRRHTSDEIDPASIRRRLGHADFDVLALDLTSPDLQRSLGLKPEDLTGDDLTICQALADIAAEAGFEAILGPSAAIPGETTLAVMGDAIGAKSRATRDLGIRSPS